MSPAAIYLGRFVAPGANQVNLFRVPLSSDPLFTDLASALRDRLAVIADHASRDRDPQAHLKRLQEASERLDALAARVPGHMDPQFLHYLQRRSYDKALAWLEAR